MSVGSDLVATIELAAMTASAITGNGVELVVDVYSMRGIWLAQGTDLNKPTADAGKML